MNCFYTSDLPLSCVVELVSCITVSELLPNERISVAQVAAQCAPRQSFCHAHYRGMLLKQPQKLDTSLRLPQSKTCAHPLKLNCFAVILINNLGICTC
jgi:hypothetical protein